MLTAAAPLVKLAPDTTPEQQSGVRDIDQALTIFWALVERLRDAAERRAADPSGRGDHLPGRPEDRAGPAPGVPGRLR